MNVYPTLYQSTENEHTKDRSTLSDIGEEVAGQVLSNLITNLEAELLSVPHETITDYVPQYEEHDRAEDVAIDSESSTHSTQNRTYSEPEYRVADTSQRTHHTYLNALDSCIIYSCTISALLLKSQGNTDNWGSDIWMSVEELHVTLQCCNTLSLIGI